MRPFCATTVTSPVPSSTLYSLNGTSGTPHELVTDAFDRDGPVLVAAGVVFELGHRLGRVAQRAAGEHQRRRAERRDETARHDVPLDMIAPAERRDKWPREIDQLARRDAAMPAPA